MRNASYGYTKNLGAVVFEEAERRVTEALKAEGFGIIMQIDVTETMKKKLDVDYRRYKILGACNPSLAHQALSHDPLIGLLLPCNVVVFEEDDRAITVSAANPKEMFKIVGDQAVAGLAEEVDARIRRAVAAI